MNFAKMIVTTQQKNGSRWETVETKIKEISREFYRNATEEQTIKFFRKLGGIETVQKNYTKWGFLPVRILSTSPNRERRTIREFDFL